MKKSFKKVILSLFIIISTILFIMPLKVNALEPSRDSRYSYGYVMDNYNVDIKVNENNTFDITETITAYFKASNKHGIIRSIPLVNNITRLDGTKSKNRAQITNIKVNDEYTTRRENGNLNIQIGNANKEVMGEKTYVIKYTYNIGKDP